MSGWQNDEGHGTGISRRDFLVGAGATALGAAVALPGISVLAAPPGPTAPSPVPQQPPAAPAVTSFSAGRVVRVKADGAQKTEKTADEGLVGRLLDRALVLYTGAPDPVAALRRFVTPDDVVGLKVNCLGSRYMATSTPVVFHLVRRLQDLGVPPDRIVIFDQYGSRMRNSGFQTLDVPGKVKVVHHELWGFSRETVRVGKGRARFCETLRRLTAVINLPVPKDHDLTGVTGSLKNMAFGCIESPGALHGSADDAIGAVYALPDVRSKVKLVVCDALRTLWHGGPQDNSTWKAFTHQVMVGADPVAMDLAILEMVNAQRKAHRTDPISLLPSRGRRHAVHILNAGRLGLGIGDPALLRVEDQDLL